MPCLIALVILAFLSIFSVKYRALAKEAFNCVFRRLTLRPCQTGFNQKVKTTVSSWFLRRNEKIGGFVFKRFEILSWCFVILFTLTGIYVGRSVYFYVKFGSCNPSEPQTCIVNQLTGTATSIPTTPNAGCDTSKMEEVISKMRR